MKRIMPYIKSINRSNIDLVNNLVDTDIEKGGAEEKAEANI